MDINIYQPVEDFEKAIAEYAGSKYACVVNSATNALLLACAYNFKFNPLTFDGKPSDWSLNTSRTITIPKRTYVSVPMSIIHAGGTVKFEDIKWQDKGIYQLKPYPIWDSARLCTSGMHKKDQFECISLHWGKTFNLGQGGVILHDDMHAQAWFKKARFDGRTQGVLPKDDEVILGWHCYMSPRDAADALTRLHFLPKHNYPLPEEKGYTDLSKLKIFKGE